MLQNFDPNGGADPVGNACFLLVELHGDTLQRLTERAPWLASLRTWYSSSEECLGCTDLVLYYIAELHEKITAHSSVDILQYFLLRIGSSTHMVKDICSGLQ